MLSREAYDVANCLVTSGFSLHDLRASMIYAESIEPTAVDEYVRSGLRELVRLHWLEWTFESNYGNVEPESPDTFDLQNFDADWERCVVTEGFREVTPDSDNPTLFLEGRDELIKELEKSEYGQYDDE